MIARRSGHSFPWGGCFPATVASLLWFALDTTTLTFSCLSGVADCVVKWQTGESSIPGAFGASLCGEKRTSTTARIQLYWSDANKERMRAVEAVGAIRFALTSHRFSFLWCWWESWDGIPAPPREDHSVCYSSKIGNPKTAVLYSDTAHSRPD